MPRSHASACRRFRRETRGFTIIEVMMAATILVVGFMGMIQAITIGSEMLATARRQTLAAQIITHEVEKLRLQNWTSISALTNAAAAAYSSDSAAIGDAILTSGVSFTLQRDVTAIVASELYEVKFTVRWTKGGTTTAATAATGSWIDQMTFFSPSPIARTYTRSMTSYFGKYGLNLNTRR
jgi:prepilin-type N-terminal cleavage/methylation domain-containing protein